MALQSLNHEARRQANPVDGKLARRERPAYADRKAKIGDANQNLVTDCCCSRQERLRKFDGK
jgi:hypothetical protein